MHAPACAFHKVSVTVTINVLYVIIFSKLNVNDTQFPIFSHK